MDKVNTLVIAFGILSVVMLWFAVARGVKLFWERRFGKGDAIYRKSTILTPFQHFVLWFFLGVLIFFFPLHYYGICKGSTITAVRLVEAISQSIYTALRLFLLDADYDPIKDGILEMGLQAWLAGACRIYVSVLNVIAPVITAGFALSFIKNAWSYLRYTFSFSKRVFYISELNEKSIALATDVLSKRKLLRPIVVFFDVFENQEEQSSELIERAKRLGAILFQKDIVAISLKPWRRSLVRKFFFVSENEDENLKQALTMIDYCRQNERLNCENTRFYVFSTTAESEALLDSVDNGNMKVRRVSENKNLVINTFLENDLFADPYQEREGDPKQVNVLIVGSGTYGVELLKAYCWCGQIPGYRLSVHVVDKEEQLQERLASLAPELLSMSGVKREGEPYYDLHFYPATDVRSGSFDQLLGSIGRITTAFVTLGEDELNVEVAMKIRQAFGKLHVQKGYSIPAVYSVVYSTLKNQIFRHEGGLKSLGKHDYGIRFIGDVSVRFSLKNIEQQELEEMGLAVHLGWLEHMREEVSGSAMDEAEINARIKESRAAYDKYEYYRRASISTVVHRKVLEKVGTQWTEENNAAENEHKRWNAFMRAEGYVYHKKRDHIAKTHPDLISYHDLTELEKSKDNIVHAGK